MVYEHVHGAVRGVRARPFSTRLDEAKPPPSQVAVEDSLMSRVDAMPPTPLLARSDHNVAGKTNDPTSAEVW